MKPSVIIALIVGGVVGFAVGNMFRSNTGTGAPTIAMAPSPAAPEGRPMAPPQDATVFKVPLSTATSCAWR